MAYDIRLSTNYHEHHKILRLRELCGAEGVIAHQKLMFYAREQRPDGVFRGLDKEDLCLIIRYECTTVESRSFVVDSMIKLKLLDVDSDGVISLHDWQDHNPYSVESIDKSDKNRLNQLARYYPEEYKTLVSQGVSGISKDEYEAIKLRYESYTTVDTVVSTTRIPPVPSPQSPTQYPDKNTDPITHGSKIPSLDEVREFFQMQGLSPSADAFFHHHEGTGWKIGKTPIQNWRSIALKWEQKEGQYKQNQVRGSLQSELQQIADTDLGGIANA